MSGKLHVLFITVDQWPGYLLGCAGHPVIETPTLDQLSASGTRFDRCYAEVPVCIPARRSIMTGMSAKGHGDRTFQPSLRMPEGVPTLASTFRDAGYQAFATGKLHVYPPRDRVGFEDALIAEEGRGHLGGPDDYEIFLADRGHVGAQFLHGMSNNEYSWTTWHLPDDLHVTNWTTTAGARQIKRRDPTRPGFWHVSYTHPHPPLVPLANYFDRYARREVPPPVTADWAAGGLDDMPYLLRASKAYFHHLASAQLDDTRRAFYALCTHIDHQIRLLIGTLREEGLLDDTIIVFTSDHGEMLGDFGLFGKRMMYDNSARVPLIVVDAKGRNRVPAGAVDNRLVGLHDLMPTMLDLAGIEIPDTVEGISALGAEKRHHLYGESLEGARASRMIRDDHFKLIWYPAGNHFQLFDMNADPREMNDLSRDPGHADVLAGLQGCLRDVLYGTDLALVAGSDFVGLPEPAVETPDNRGLSGQRGLHYPPIPLIDPDVPVGSW